MKTYPPYHCMLNFKLSVVSVNMRLVNIACYLGVCVVTVGDWICNRVKKCINDNIFLIINLVLSFFYSFEGPC